MTKLSEAFKSENPYLVECPNCEAKIPPNIKGCWHCGKILDPHLIELMEANEK